MKKVPVVFLDRDGVINRQAAPHQYIIKWEDFHYLPHVYEAITLLNQNYFKIFIVSNQRCVARGMATIKEIESLHYQITVDLQAHNCHVDKFYYCPHDEVDQCNCRKPKTGMLQQAQQWLESQGLTIDKEKSWMVGDFMSDIQTGINFGVNTVHILSDGKDTSDAKIEITDTLQHLEAANLLEAVKDIIAIKFKKTGANP